jgi:hypothetical protein
MPANDPNETVRQILKRKYGLILRVPLDPGSPSWNDVMDAKWSEILRGAKRNKPGYNTLKKVLRDGRFDIK